MQSFNLYHNFAVYKFSTFYFLQPCYHFTLSIWRCLWGILTFCRSATVLRQLLFRNSYLVRDVDEYWHLVNSSLSTNIFYFFHYFLIPLLSLVNTVVLILPSMWIQIFWQTLWNFLKRVLILVDKIFPNLPFSAAVTVSHSIFSSICSFHACFYSNSDQLFANVLDTDQIEESFISDIWCRFLAPSFKLSLKHGGVLVLAGHCHQERSLAS